MGIFSKRSRAANSAVHGRIRLNSEFVQDFMVVLLTCKNEEDLIKNEGARVLTRLSIIFFRCPRAAQGRIQASVCWGGGGGHNQARGQGGRLGPLWVQGKALVGGSGGEAPDGKRFSVF